MLTITKSFRFALCEGLVPLVCKHALQRRQQRRPEARYGLQRDFEVVGM